MSLLAYLLRKPQPKPIISVGPIPINVGDRPESERHLPWKCAQSIVGENGCVSLLGHPDESDKWAYAKAMCDYYHLRMCPQYEALAPHPEGAPWSVCDIETLRVVANARPYQMASVAYDQESRHSAKIAALNAPGHIAFTIYPQLSGVVLLSELRAYLQPLVDSCKRFPGKRWISEFGINLWQGNELFQADAIRLATSIPGLAGFNYVFVCDSPGYATLNRNRGGSFWWTEGLFDSDGNERPAAAVLRKAAKR